MKTARHPRPSIFAAFFACLAAGCVEVTSPPPPSPTARTSPPAEVADAKPDRDSVLAALKEQGIAVVAPDEIEMKSYRYTNIGSPMEWVVEIDRKPLPDGQENPIRISLPPDTRAPGSGTFDMALLPPRSTGRGGLLVFLRSVSDEGGVSRVVARDAPPIWSGGPNRGLGSQGMGQPLTPRGIGRAYRLITYMDRRDPSIQEILTLRCRLVKPAGSPPGETETSGTPQPLEVEQARTPR